MHRFFSPSQNISGNKIILSDKGQVHHLKDVLRLKTKDKVVIFDDSGKEYDCIIDKVSDKVVLNIKEMRLSSKTQREAHITVACAIPKKSKFDDIVDKLTQLGVDKIIPLITQRTIVELDSKKKQLRLSRWQKIALSASLQSQRTSVPVIEPIKGIKEILSTSADYDLKLIPTLNRQRKTLSEVFNQTKPKNILVLIGPEGDFTEEEVSSAIKFGFVPVSLGDLVLRVETAAIAIVSTLNYILCTNSHKFLSNKHE